MMAVIKPLDRKRTPKPSQRRGSYNWTQWLIPGQEVTLIKADDFPETKAESVRQAAYNAATRYGVIVEGELPEGPDGTVVKLYVYYAEK